MTQDKEKQKEGLKELAIARIRIMPPNYKLSIGDKGTFTKEEIIERIKSGDETGLQIIGMQMNFIKALTSGKLTEVLNK